MKFIINSFSGSVALETPVLTNVYANKNALPYPTNALNVLFMGQSNAVSRNSYTDTIGESNNLPYDGYIKNAKYWNDTLGSLQNFTVSNNQYLADVTGDYGLNYQLAQDLLKTRKIGQYNLYKFAEGGTAIGTNGGFGKWASPSGVRTVDAVTKFGGKSFDYLIWFQGETDSTDATDAANYQTNLTALMTYLKTQMTINKIIIVRLGAIPAFTGTGADAVRAAQDAYVTGDSDAYLVTPDYTGDDFTDPQHINLTSQTRLGRQIATLIESQL